MVLFFPLFIGYTVSLWCALFGIIRLKNCSSIFFLRLYGTTLSQTMAYLRSFPEDTKGTKCLVSESTPSKVQEFPIDMDRGRFVFYGMMLISKSLFV